ncbi:MAG: phospholipid carrier-dependent glycosyltransferase [Candidatus Binatia bacterium]
MVYAFAVAIGVTYLSLLGHAGLAEPDEPRYGEIAREMLELRDWVTPHLNYVKYFEKPPLVYWLTAINLHCFGTSEFVVRLWPALFGLLGIGLADALGRSMYGAWTGHAAAALLATTPLYFGLSQIVILDMPLSALMTVALAAFWFAYTAPDTGRRRRWVSLLYVATALAVLTKGPVAIVLTGGVVASFLLVRRDLEALRWLLSPLDIGLFLLIAVPWFLLVSHRNPEFADFFVFKQHVARFLTPDEHQQSLWFFVPIVWAGMLPWSVFLLAPRILGQFCSRLVTRRTSAASLFCVLWAGVVFAFFSLSGSKLATYILPMFCPLALLAARFFEQVITNHQANVLRRGCVAFAVVAVALLIGTAVTGAVVDVLLVRAMLRHLYAGTLVLGATAGIALLLARRDTLQATFATLVAGMLLLQVVAISGRSVAAQYRPLGLAIRAQAKPDDIVASYRHYVQGITFYTQRRVIMIGGWGELDFGRRQGDQRAFFWDTDQQLLDAWRGERHFFLVINRSELEPLRPRMQPAPRQIAAHGKKVVIVNFP